ncbi:hypothetical protein G6F58_013043 [Rhizopus delemar]|nr:hypothetical protein G6F58_013043 [Rhizopus delemar]
MPIPKPMRWGDHAWGFARPAHWLVLLHGGNVVEADLFGLQAGRVSPAGLRGSPARRVRAGRPERAPRAHRRRGRSRCGQGRRQRPHHRGQPGAGGEPGRVAVGGAVQLRARVPGGAAGSADRDDGDQPEVLPGAG